MKIFLNVTQSGNSNYKEFAMIKTLAETIIWMAHERMKEDDKVLHVNNAIVAVCLEADQLIMDYMRDAK
jgi:predicted peptidase